MKKFVYLLPLAASLVACGGTGYDPVADRNLFFRHVAAQQNETVVSAVEGLRCPAGMQPKSDAAKVESYASARHEQNLGGKRRQYRVYGRTRASSGYVSEDPNRIRTVVGANAERKLTCGK